MKLNHLPEGLFIGVEAWDQIGKERRVKAWLSTLPDSRIFPQGRPPKHKPSSGYIHSTCGCWQCCFCHNVILRRALQDERAARWEAARPN